MSINKKSYSRLLLKALCTTGLSSICLASNAYAQPAEPSAQLDEIIVTATKRSKNLQDAAISVQAILKEPSMNSVSQVLTIISSFYPMLHLQVEVRGKTRLLFGVPEFKASTFPLQSLRVPGQMLRSIWTSSPLRQVAVT